MVLLLVGLSGVARVIARSFRTEDESTDEDVAKRPRMPIRTASGASLRVAGRVRALGDVVTAPMSGGPCVAFQLQIEEWKSRYQVGSWHLLLDLQDARSFSLADETGDAFVDAAGPFVLALGSDEAGTNDPREPMDSGRMTTLTSLLGGYGKSWLGSKPLRYREGVLVEGDVVSVGGDGTRELNPAGRSPNSRDLPEWLVLRGTDDAPLWISDAPISSLATRELGSRAEPQKIVPSR
jgi:hypothetical protein